MLTVEAGDVAGVLRITGCPQRDERGYFSRTLDPDELAGHGVELRRFLWSSTSRSYRGVIRGLHVRVSPGEAKIIGCARGRVFDVAVDLRPWSPTFLRHQSFLLDEDRVEHLYLPEGVAHGFQALTASADLTYRIDRRHAPQLERVIAPRDADLGVAWPLAPATMSARDAAAPGLAAVIDDLGEWFGRAVPVQEGEPCVP